MKGYFLCLIYFLTLIFFNKKGVVFFSCVVSAAKIGFETEPSYNPFFLMVMILQWVHSANQKYG